MFSLALMMGAPAGASPLELIDSDPEVERAKRVDPCLQRGAVRRCDVLQLAVHTPRGSFDGFVFAMHHPQADVFWFREPQSGAFLKVVAPEDRDTPFLGEGWQAVTADGRTYHAERVLRETYVLRRSRSGTLARN